LKNARINKVKIRYFYGTMGMFLLSDDKKMENEDGI
jgi:hypothetical protein